MVLKQSRSWRLIDVGSFTGNENMAFDEAILRSFNPETSRPVLRLYGWNQATISLGRFQNADKTLNPALCKSDNLSVVRRITGGGVIYHADELTYSIVCSPSQIPPASSIKDSFRILTGFLLSFYAQLGLDAGYAADVLPGDSSLGERTSFCFAGKETFDILIGGKKIGGNAQRRMKNIIFQHGSIPIIDNVLKGITYMQDSVGSLDQKVSSLQKEGVNESTEKLKLLLGTAFENHFGITLTRDTLNYDEESMYFKLLNNKYLNDSWNLNGVEK